MAATNTEVLANYREQKKTFEGLAIKARKQMQVRFTELLAEAATLVADYRTDFGVNPDLPADVKTFTLSDGKKKSAKTTPATPATSTGIGPKIGGLRRSLNSAIARGDTAKITEVSAQLAALGVDVAAALVVEAEPAEVELVAAAVAIPQDDPDDDTEAELDF